MRYSILFILFFLLSNSVANNRVKKISKPNWVKTITFSEENIIKESGSYQYLLTDYQNDINKKVFYRHLVIKILNTEGVQEMSNISLAFDPSFEKIHFHQIRIKRGDSYIEKLKESEIRLFQRESNLERSLYDGALTATINLTDIRVGDIIEYAYSINGSNPIYKGHYSDTYHFQFSIPVNRIHLRMISSKKRKLRYKLFEKAIEPQISQVGENIEFLWDVNALETVLYDNNVPSWLNVQKRVSFTTFKDWKEVVDLAFPLYKYSKNDIIQIKKEFNLSGNKDEKIIRMIRVVQDDIRYLGFESGIGAYKPNKPLKVYNQRFGDCKDKSLLLTALLRSEGVTAYPTLVNTYMKNEIIEKLPSFTAFNHCIVNFKYKDQEYFIDPTISNQGGDLDAQARLNYKMGLLVKAGESELSTFPEYVKPKLEVQENIYVDSINGRAKLEIISRYWGAKADNIRSYFSSNSRELIQKEYLNYYSSLYDNVEVDKDVEFIDKMRSSSNLIITKEYYKVDNIWAKSEDQNMVYLETTPVILKNLIDFPGSANRSMPYVSGTPHTFTQTTKLYLPEFWPVAEESENVKGDGFYYEYYAKGKDSCVTVYHNYDIDKEVISEKDVDSFLKQHEKIRNDLPFYLTYNYDLTGFKLSWISILIAILSIIISIYLAVKIYKEYDPIAKNNGTVIPIGGWLVLPAIGIIITPIVLLYQMISNDFFNHNCWLNIFNYDKGKAISFGLLYGSEIFFNFLLLVFCLLLLTLFFNKRTSLPRLITIFYIANCILLVGDQVLSELIIPELFTDVQRNQMYKEISKSIMAVIIWVPFFNISQSVKNTFCERYSNN